MRKKSNNEKQLFFNQIDQSEHLPEKKQKFHFWDKSLLLKQTLIAAWKNKLQLVILLLLTAFTTSLITGSWISYQRIIEGQETLELSDANFDAVLPYESSGFNRNITQIANQAFSLSLGRLYYQDSSTNDSVAVYFDNSIIGQEIQPLRANNLIITYTRDSNNIINGITNFQWANASRPLEFNLKNDNVKASMYGQLMLKAQQSNNKKLKDKYLAAATELYNNLFVNFSAHQILASLQKYFTDWIRVNNDDAILASSDYDFTTNLINHKVNYSGPGSGLDLRIPNEVNIATDAGNATGVLATRLVKETDSNPRLTSSTSSDYGMNGQWMTIYRKFDVPNLQPSVIKNFLQNYSSPSNYNMIYDNNLVSDDSPSFYFAQAAAGLQNRQIHVMNQFVTTAGMDSRTGNSINVKVVNIGLKQRYNNTNLKIFEGIYPTSRNELVISPQYARAYGYRPGDIINISNRSFIVSGIGGDAYNIYPTLNPLDPIPNTRNELIIYVYPDTFNDKEWVADNDKTDISLMYFLPWKDVSVPRFDTNYFNDYFQRTIFSDNGLNDRFQYDYNHYLVAKYVDNDPDYRSLYQINPNLVVAEGDSQFSLYTRGRDMLRSTLLGFKYMAYIGVIFLVAIIIFITYLIIKKAIQKGQVSMGILKSSGYSTWRIITSYLAYPIIVLLVAIPIGWFVGLAIQIYFTEIFNTLFILPYNVLDFKFIPLLISIAIICGFVLITTLITGYRMLQKGPLMLMNQNSDIAGGSGKKVAWVQEKLKNRFKFRFILSLSKTSWKKIAITSVVIAVATLAITATVSIPATINSMKDTYFKTQKYKNYYQYQTPIPNMPLSKYGLYSWNNFNNVNDEPYYPVSGGMPWPEDIIINDTNTGKKLAWYNPLEYQKNSDNTSNFNEILHAYPGTTEPERLAIVDNVGRYLLSLRNGPLEMSLLTWSYSWMGGRVFSNALLQDLASGDLSENKNFSNSLINFASTLLPGILGVPNPGVPPGPNAIVAILKQVLPGFIRQVLDNQGPSAYDYFAIGHNSISYNPNYDSEIDGAQEELVTQFQLGSADNNLIDKDFLDVEGINPDTKMLVMNSNLVNGLRYNASANVIPMVINRSFAAKYNLSIGNEFNASPKVKTLYYQTDDRRYLPIPKENWYYGADPTNQDIEGSKAVWNKSANKWNFRGEQAVGESGYNDSFGYRYDGVYNKDGQRELLLEPEGWNDINKIWLKLPANIIASAKSGYLRSADAVTTYNFKTSNIAAPGDSNWIRPFSYDVADDFNGRTLDPIEILLNRVPEWYGGMLDQSILISMNNLNPASIKSDIENNMPEWWRRVVGVEKPLTRYHIIGIQDSYDTSKAYIDQKWANLIAGYSYFGDRSQTKDPTYASGDYQWFSGKLSGADDIYDIVGRMAFKRRSDDYSMYSMGSLQGNFEEPLIQNSDLLVRKKEMMNKMAEIALSASLLFIITTIICSILIVIMITDSFTDQFRRFMSHMKAEGYTNKEINSFTLGIFTPWALVGYLAGYSLGFLTIFAFIQVLTRFLGLAFPFSFIWWIIPLSFGIIALIYFSTFIINNYQLNKMDLIGLLKTDG